MYTVTNISVEILMSIQIFTLLNVASFLEGIKRSSLIKKIEQTKQDRYFDETNFVEILTGIQIFTLVNAASFLEGIKRSSLIKKNRTNKARQIL